MISILSPQQTEWLAMTLLHSLWQAALIAFLLVSILQIIPASRANSRYLVSLFAIFSVPVSALVTWWWLSFRSPVHPPSGDVAAASPAAIVTGNWALSWEGCLVVFWVLGVGVMTLRILFSLARQHTLRSQSTPAGQSVLDVVRRLVEKRPTFCRVEVLMTQKLKTAAVCGILRPILFVPTAMVNGLSTRQLEAVIAHELAHIRRFDAVVDFVQMLVEAILFFNPAVWWMSRQLRQEREACCDAIGVQTTGDPGFYSETLATWAEQVRRLADGTPTPAGVLGFASERKSTLTDRVRRVLFPGHVPQSHFSPISSLFLFLAGVVLFGSLWKGTQVAVAIVDDLLPHEVVVADLNETREKFAEKRLPLREEPQYAGPMTIRIEVATAEGSPPTSSVDVSYSTFRNVENSSNSSSGSLTGIAAGETEKEVVLKHSWAHLLFSAEGYAPIVVKDVRPDESGFADVKIKLESGFDGNVKVVAEDGQPVPGAKLKLNHLLKYSHESRPSRSTRTRRSNSVGSPVGDYLSDEDGTITVPNVCDQPYFSGKITAEGFETHDVDDFKWEDGSTRKIVLSRALPVKGKVVDGHDQPLSGVRIYEVSRVSDGKNHQHHGSNSSFCRKDFQAAVAETDESGGFEINSFHSDWEYTLLADAGDRGYQFIPGIRPGNSVVTAKVPGPLTIRGTVVGEIERLRTKDGEKYQLGYGMRPLMEGSTSGDMSGRIPLEIRDGKATFELQNVLPGRYEFFTKDWKRLVRDLSVTESATDVNIVVPSVATASEPEIVTKQRDVQLNFHSTKGVAPFRGRISVFSRSRNSISYYSRPLDVTGDFAEFPVNAPSKVTVEVLDAPGFVFKNGVDLKFELNDDSTETYVQSVDVFPAGVIFGQLVRPEWASSGDWLGVMGNTSWRTKSSYRSSSVSRQCDKDGRFFLDHVNYGSTTQLLARCGSWCEVLRPIAINAGKPKVQVKSAIGNGPTLTGVMKDASGIHVRNMDVQLLLFTSEHEKHSIGTRTTDQNGAFSFGPINPKAGEHFVRIAPAKNYAPVFVSIDDSGRCEIVLQPGGIVEGRLVDDESGQPIVGEEVYAMIKYRPRAVHACEAEAKTDEDGFFRFSNLGDELYELHARVVRRQVVPKTVKPGQRNVELRLKPRQD